MATARKGSQTRKGEIYTHKMNENQIIGIAINNALAGDMVYVSPNGMFEVVGSSIVPFEKSMSLGKPKKDTGLTLNIEVPLI